MENYPKIIPFTPSYPEHCYALANLAKMIFMTSLSCKTLASNVESTA